MPVTYVKFDRPSHLADAAGTNVWDIGLIGAEPQRAEKIAFTSAYCEIEATYLVPPGSPISSIAEVDRPGVRITTRRGAAYDLWLERNIKDANAAAVGHGGRRRSTNSSPRSLRPVPRCGRSFSTDVKKLPGRKILPGNFMTVQQAIGTAKPNTAGAAFLSEFVAEAKKSGLVARLIEKHHVKGLSVAP